jgi:molybdate transport system substrate-binding protein
MAKLVSKIRVLVGAVIAIGLGLPGAVRAAEVPVVAAASDLQYALADVAEAFSRATGLSVKLALGSSGNFTRQIIQGAPFEVFFSADEDYVRELAERSLTLDRGVAYAIGRLVLYVPKGSPVKADPDMNDLAAAAADGRLRRLAIANPEHAPYGRAARAALMQKGLWDKLQARLVLGENISQAAQFALSGSVEAGLIARSLAISDRMASQGSFALLPQESHPPLRQRMVLLKGAGETARRFYAFVQTSPARAAFERYGFELPPAGN